MKVILLEDIRNLGKLGDTVQVKAGYARNFLIPQKKAALATKENLAVFEAKRAELEKVRTEQLAAAQKRADTLQNLQLTIPVKAHENKLFGSVGPREIAQTLSEKGFAVEKREINMPEGPIHELGEHPIQITLHSDLSINITANIVAEE